MRKHYKYKKWAKYYRICKLGCKFYWLDDGNVQPVISEYVIEEANKNEEFNEFLREYIYKRV